MVLMSVYGSLNERDFITYFLTFEKVKNKKKKENMSLDQVISISSMALAGHLHSYWVKDSNNIPSKI